ncbi:MAG TPA: hypothetical protein VK625_15810, partial [Flavitalea sp.]|nr:hypothetical protein [Flavitalea sp.]
MRSFLMANSISAFCLCALIQFKGVNAQEYHKSPRVKSDSIEEGNLKLIRDLQQVSPAGTVEVRSARSNETPAGTD